MRIAPDITGYKVGMLTVVRRVGSSPKDSLWECFCGCGGVKIKTGAVLRRGGNMSCGCLGHPKSNLRHGQSRTPLHLKWQAMRRRCENKKNASWPNYGGRGISVCDQWQTFEVFRDWSLANGYTPGLEIDRVDVDGDYCPENCRYISASENRSRTRRTAKHSFFGEQMTLVVAEQRFGVSRSVISKRIARGMSPDAAVKDCP